MTNYTEPAATLYRENVDGRLLMSKPIDNITENEGLISFVACRPELAVPEPDGGTEVEGEAAFTITWPAVSGATSYELEVTEIGTAAKTPEEALVKSTDFAKFQSKSVGFTDVSGKMAEYGLASWGGSKLFTSPDGLRIGTSKDVGYVKTPNWYMTQSSELTVVFGGKPVKDGTTVKGKVVFNPFNQGDATSSIEPEEVSFEMSEETRLVYNFSTRKEGFWIEFRPEGQVALNYFALYDGTWTAEQLFVTDARANAPRRATTVTNYTTDTNSITLKDLNKSSRYIYKVRALGEEDTFSQWSAEREFSFSNTDGIINLMSTPKDDVIYDLQGHRRSSVDLPKGIYIIGGKKVVK